MAQFPNTTNADGIWTLKKVRREILGGNWPGSALSAARPNAILYISDSTTDETGTFTISPFGGATTTATSSNVKYGSASLEFNGSTSYFLTNVTPTLEFGTGDFTVEAWIKINSASTSSYIRPFAFIGGSAGQLNLERYQQSTGTNPFRINTASGRGTYTAREADVTEYNHIAIERVSGTTRMYLNGLVLHEVTDPTNYDHDQLIIGALSSSAYHWNGWVDELCISKGTAVYGGEFTPPTSQFVV